MRSTETANLVSSSPLNQTHAGESVQPVTHSRTHFVFLNVCQDLETTDSEVVSLKELSLDVHSHTSSNKAHVCQLVMPDLILTLTLEFVMPAHPTVSHACHLLSVPAAAQVSTLGTTSVSLVKDVPITDSNTTEFASNHAQLVLSSRTDTAKEDATPILYSWTTSVILLAQLDSP